jgi:uncharacterized membrane protein YqiK
VSSRRLVPKRRAGIVNEDAPFWRGETAEQILEQRFNGYRLAREEKAVARVKAREERKSARAAGRAPRARRERSPNQQLKRLERNLGRRKTLAARQRIEQQIKSLKQQLGIA